MRTSRENNGAAMQNKNKNAKTLRMDLVPSASAMGPAIAIPIGAKASEPNASYDITFESDSFGMCCCKVVTQRT